MDRQPPVVCVGIVGGLGNQMFGAAAGLALATRLRVTRVIDRLRILIVSDEETAARELLSGWGDRQFIKGATPLDDMQIIASCRHRIIANSSCSWWGAWLDSRTDGITIAPRAWFSRKQMLTTFTGDLMPTGWILT